MNNKKTHFRIKIMEFNPIGLMLKVLNSQNKKNKKTLKKYLGFYN